MKKHGILEYYLYDTLPGDKEETKRVIVSSEITYESEEEVKQLIKEMDEEVYNDRFKADKNVVKRSFTEYTIDQCIANETELVNQYIYGLFRLINEKKEKDLIFNPDINHGLVETTWLNKKTKKKETTYLLDGIEISKETYERYLEEHGKERKLNALVYFKERISAERIVRRTFDISKLSVKEFDKCIELLSEASYKKEGFSNALNFLRDKYKHALLA